MIFNKLKNKNSSLAFLAGVFLGAGSVSIPISEDGKKKYGHHFEIVVVSKSQADILAEILATYEIFPKIVERGDNYVLYVKNIYLAFYIKYFFKYNKILSFINIVV